MKVVRCASRLELARIATVFLCAACDIATIRPIPDPDSSAGPGSTQSPTSKAAFDPDRHVVEIWDSKLIPAIRDGALDFQSARDSLSKDGGPRFVRARVKGKVTSVEDRGRSRQVGIDLDPFDTKPDLWIQIGGPDGVDGNAVRDGSGVVSFDQFTNQLEFAYVATSLGKYIEAHVVLPVQEKLAPGTTVEATGVLFQIFEEQGPVSVLAPVSLSVEAKAP